MSAFSLRCAMTNACRSAVKTLVHKYVKKGHVQESRQMLLMVITGSAQYKMGWWRPLDNDCVLINLSLYIDHYGKQTKYLPVARSDKAAEEHEDHEYNDAEKIYDLFRNTSLTNLWPDYCTLIKAENREGGDGSEIKMMVIRSLGKKQAGRTKHSSLRSCLYPD